VHKGDENDDDDDDDDNNNNNNKLTDRSVRQYCALYITSAFPLQSEVIQTNKIYYLR
jgi:hypothetical protein